MKSLFDITAPTTTVNLSLNSDLVKKSRALNINLTAALEEVLSHNLAEHVGKKWVYQNRNAIRAYNEHVEQNGCFGDEYRDF